MYIAYLKVQILLLLFLLSGCRQNNMDETGGIAVIDVVPLLGKYQQIPVSEIISGLEYIPLETSDDCLIGGMNNIIVTPVHIFVAGGAGFGQGFCYVFDRNGRFIRQIGRTGQGPGEYTTIMGLSIDKQKESLYLQTIGNRLLEYSFDGILRQSISLKTMSDGRIQEVYALQENLFIGHVPNDTGNELYNFVLFNDSGQVIKSFENHIKFNRVKSISSSFDSSIMPYKVSGNIYVKEFTNDTIYCLNEQKELIPEFVFNLGKYGFPKQLKEEFLGANASAMLKDVLIIPSKAEPMVGAPNYIFFSLWGHSVSFPLPKGRVRNIALPFGQRGDVELSTPLGIYDIAAKTTRLLDTDPFSGYSGLINDLDGGLSFWPRSYTDENELVGVWMAEDMKSILTEAYFASREIKNPQAHQKLKELLKNLDWEDNPIIVIAKLKP